MRHIWVGWVFGRALSDPFFLNSSWLSCCLHAIFSTKYTVIRHRCFIEDLILVSTIFNFGRTSGWSGLDLFLLASWASFLLVPLLARQWEKWSLLSLLALLKLNFSVALPVSWDPTRSWLVVALVSKVRPSERRWSREIARKAVIERWTIMRTISKGVVPHVFFPLDNHVPKENKTWLSTSLSLLSKKTPRDWVESHKVASHSPH